MKKTLLVAILAVMSGIVMAKTDAENHNLTLVTNLLSRYKVYSAGESGFMFIDARRAGRFASMSIPTIRQSGEAGYAIIPGRNFDEMSNNSQFAKGYSVDCNRNVIYNEEGQPTRASEMNELHQLAAEMACMALEGK